ncbi:hypothetical protein KEM54_006168 [Ascosphaera aggregata]|nr:hypothetical protein KEM54_006168 [Ascosphaera aggregata]
MDQDNDIDKRHVPKFASFKPKVPADADQHKDKSRERSPRRHEHHKSQHRREHHIRHLSPTAHRQQFERRKDRDSHQGSHEKEGRHHRHEHIRRHDEALRGIERSFRQDNSALYAIDARGDPYNVVYGSLHRHDVPHYHRTGRGRVLGVPLSYWIDRDSLDGKSMILRTNSNSLEDALSRRRQNAAWKQARHIKTLYRIRRDPEANAGEDLRRDFISVHPQRAHKRRRLNENESSGYSSLSSDHEVDYRSIEGKAKASMPVNIVLESEVTADDDIAGSAARQKNAELSKRVAEHPDDIYAWLELIRHQETLVGTVDVDNNRILTSAEKRSIADVRLSMYQKALASASDETPRDRLILGLLEEGAKLWDTKLLANKWRNYLQQYPSYMTLWVKYLDFQQTSFLNFTYEKSRDLITSCIELNKSSIQPGSSSQRISEQKEIHLYLFLRLTLLMRESGFSEHAVALWQALLEYNFFRPKSFSSAYDEAAALTSFNTFWDSEVARIGEPGAKGWGSSEGKSVEPLIEETLGSIDPSSPFKSWEVAEWNRMRASFLPARTLDETVEDDPYRIILSSDIEKFLMNFIESEMSEVLLNAFLLFCRLPPLYSESTRMSHWRVDPFIFNECMDTRSNIGQLWYPSIFLDFEIRAVPPVNRFPLPNFQVTPETLFADDQWFSVFRSFQELHSDSDQTLLPTNWILRAIRHLVTRLADNERLAEYSAALEYACNPDSAKAYVKRLLKQQPLCLSLYNAYAIMEFRDGEDAAAERILSTTLTMSAGRVENSIRDGRSLLWVTWIWQALKGNDLVTVMRLLAAVPDGGVDYQKIRDASQSASKMSPAEILRSQRFFTGIAEYGLANTRETSFANATECLALLKYVTEERNLQGALSVYANAEAQLLKHTMSSTGEVSPIRERLHQSKSKLLYYHASSTRLYKPSLLRDELTKSIPLFPSNTMFLDLFSWNENRFRIEDRVRSIMKQHTSFHTRPQSEEAGVTTTTSPADNSKLIPHLYAIVSEVHRGVSAGSTIHSVRAAFESAVSSESATRSSASLWKLYILFECKVAQGQKARDVFFRSIRACPWAKELVLLAFREEVLRDAIAGAGGGGVPGTGGEGSERTRREQLRKVWNVLVEKELRVHVDLGKWFEDQGLVGSDDYDQDATPFEMPIDEDSMDEES